jgi:hypothetical protein
VCPLIQKVDAGQLHLLGRHEPDGEIPYDGYAEATERVILKKML